MWILLLIPSLLLALSPLLALVAFAQAAPSTDAARSSFDRLEALLDEKERALQQARDLLGAWRAELDSGEPWPDDPLPC